MPAIRCRFNGSCYVLSPKVKYGKAPLCGETVQVITGDDWEREPFSGFTDMNSLSFDNTVLITGIDAYNPGDEILDKWTEFSQCDWLLACRAQYGILLVIKDNLPIIAGSSDLYSRTYPIKHTNNVHKIGGG